MISLAGEICGIIVCRDSRRGVRLRAQALRGVTFALSGKSNQKRSLGRGGYPLSLKTLSPRTKRVKISFISHAGTEGKLHCVQFFHTGCDSAAWDEEKTFYKDVGVMYLFWFGSVSFG
jgi:hypothetical protein